MTKCTKSYYADQASARVALAAIREKKSTSGKLPIRVYPCDVCDGWHVTAKRSVGRKKPPWERDPDWSRPNGLAGLEKRGRTR